MFRSNRLMTGLLALTMAAGACFAEEPTATPTKFYKMEFVVKEVEGSKVLNSRMYTATVSTGASKVEIRAGSKIPFSSSNSNVELIDVGVNVDVFKIKEGNERLLFGVVVEISSVADSGGASMRPTIRQNRWNSEAIVPLKKPTLVFSSENVDSKTQTQVEVTATPIP